MTAPALRRLSITGLLVFAMTSRCSLRPLVVAKPCLVDIDLHRDRHARERPGILAARDRRIDGGGLRQHLGRLVIDHGVDLRD